MRESQIVEKQGITGYRIKKEKGNFLLGFPLLPVKIRDLSDPPHLTI